jgi:two-component system response regulator AtoC
MVLQALLVDDDESTLARLASWSEGEEYALHHTGSLAEARKLLEEVGFDLVVVALRLPDGSGLQLVSELEGAAGPETMVVAGTSSVETAVDAMKRGALDYFPKPVDRGHFHASLQSARRRSELRDEVRALRRELRHLGTFGGLVGASPAMQKVYELIEQVAPTNASVLIVGETGTGKELVAQAIHRLSRRARGTFVPLNCGAIPESLIESELFGHVKGAFTGATRNRRGVFARADGGTLLLDEITEMPIELQSKLLRVLESGEYLPVGSESPQSSNARVLAASNRDPSRAVADGYLREDLLYRLNVFPIELPPLRKRTGDIELLAGHTLQRLNKEQGTRKRLSSRALEQLERHDWPGNVRELINVVRRSYILAGPRIERIAALDDHGGDAKPAASAPAPDARGFVGRSIADVERELILATLEHYGGNKKRTAEALGISLKTLYNRLNRYGDAADAVIERIQEKKTLEEQGS